MTSPAATGAELAARRQRLRRYVTLLDSGIAVPGTRWQIGIEALIGLIPGVGDLAGALLGSWLVIEAARLRVPRPLLARMIANIVFDTVLGVVPVLGDVADFVFKSNRRNLRLLDAHFDATSTAAMPATRHRRRQLLLVALLALAGGLLWHFGGLAG